MNPSKENIESRASKLFLNLISSNELETYESFNGTVFAVSSSGHLIYFNPGWFDFAQHNSGSEMLEMWPLGKNYWAAIPDVLVGFYKDIYNFATTNNANSIHAKSYKYECSTPNLQRIMHAHVYPLHNNSGTVSTHVIVKSNPILNVVTDYSIADYQNEHGLITACSNCRRVENLLIANTWDFVPEFLDSRTHKVTHGICPPCYQNYFTRYLVDGTPILRSTDVAECPT